MINIIQVFAVILAGVSTVEIVKERKSTTRRGSRELYKEEKEDINLKSGVIGVIDEVLGERDRRFKKRKTRGTTSRNWFKREVLRRPKTLPEGFDGGSRRTECG